MVSVQSDGYRRRLPPLTNEAGALSSEKPRRPASRPSTLTGHPDWLPGPVAGGSNPHLSAETVFLAQRSRGGILPFVRITLTLLSLALAISLAPTDPAYACRDYDGHRNSVVPPECGSEEGATSGANASSVDAAIDAVGLPAAFHGIAWRESGDSPFYAVNPYSGACGPFQFLPSTAAGLRLHLL